MIFLRTVVQLAHPGFLLWLFDEGRPPNLKLLPVDGNLGAGTIEELAFRLSSHGFLLSNLLITGSGLSFISKMLSIVKQSVAL